MVWTLSSPSTESLRWRPSSLYTFPVTGASLGIAISQGSPNLSAFTPEVSHPGVPLQKSAALPDLATEARWLRRPCLRCGSAWCGRDRFRLDVLVHLAKRDPHDLLAEQGAVGLARHERGERRGRGADVGCHGLHGITLERNLGLGIATPTRHVYDVDMETTTTTAPTNATTIPDMVLIIDEAFSTNYWFLLTNTENLKSTSMTWSECNGNYTARIVIQDGNTHIDIYKGSDGPRVFHIELDMTINDPKLNAKIAASIADHFDA